MAKGICKNVRERNYEGEPWQPRDWQQLDQPHTLKTRGKKATLKTKVKILKSS